MHQARLGQAFVVEFHTSPISALAALQNPQKLGAEGRVQQSMLAESPVLMLTDENCKVAPGCQA
jgi:hypothetical protein